MVTTTAHHLTPGQRAWLEAELLQQQRSLEAQLALHHEGLSQADHAASLLALDAHDAAQHQGAREVDQEWTAHQLHSLGAVSEALRHVHDDSFGLCADCGCDIPFDRLKVEPWACRCVPCTSALERRTRQR